MCMPHRPESRTSSSKAAIKLLAFAASNSSTSINRMLVEHAVARYRAEIDPAVEVELLDLNNYEMPIYSLDREEKSGIADAAFQFLPKIESAHALLVSFAEHNGTVSAAWKNIFDCMSRAQAKVWQGKPMLIMSAMPGPRAGAGVRGLPSHADPVLRGRVEVISRYRSLA